MADDDWNSLGLSPRDWKLIRLAASLEGLTPEEFLVRAMELFIPYLKEHPDFKGYSEQEQEFWASWIIAQFN